MSNQIDTPLHTAARNGNVEIVRILLANGSDVNVKNADGKTPLHLAVEEGYEEIVALLANAARNQSSDSETSTLSQQPSSIENQTVPDPTSQRKDNLAYWVCIYLGFALISTIVYFLGLVPSLAWLNDITLLVLLLPLGQLVGYFHCIAKLWEEIPKDIARTTPRKAAWFSFIPIFNFYWWFVTLFGLAIDMNKTAARYGKSALVESVYIRNACIYWAVCNFLLMILFYTDEGIFDRFVFVFNIIDLPILVIVMLYLLDKMNELINLKEGSKES